MTPTRKRILVAGVLALGSILAVQRLPVRELLLPLVGWIRDAGPLGALVFAITYALAAVALLPASLLTLAAGFIYGPIWGTALVSPASVVGATMAFALGRTVGRSWVERQVDGNPRFSAIDRAIGTGGLKVVTLLRLSPVFPFNLLNYALSLTRLRTPHFILGSFVGMLPGTFLYVYLGSLANDLTSLLSGQTPDNPGKQLLLWGGLLATVAVTTLITRSARAALQAEAAELTDPQP